MFMFKPERDSEKYILDYYLLRVNDTQKHDQISNKSKQSLNCHHIVIQMFATVWLVHVTPDFTSFQMSPAQDKNMNI